MTELAYHFPYVHFLKYKEARELIVLLLFFITVILFGVLGYELIEGWDFLDSIYMTVTTLATVGFGEVHPLSPPGRIFTIILVLFGVGVVAVALSTIAKHVVEQQLFHLFEKSRMEDMIINMKDHTIICGYGRLGRIAAGDFKDEGEPVVIIERNPESARLAREAGFPVIEGDATLDTALTEAGILRARSLVSLLSSDSENLYVVLTSRELHPDLFIISRTEDERGENRLLRAGANRTVSPYREGGQKIASALLRPYVTDFIDKAVSGEGKLIIEEIQVASGSPVTGQTLQGIRIREKTNIIVAAIVRPGGEVILNPGGDTSIETGSTMIVLGERDKVKELEALIVPS